MIYDSNYILKKLNSKRKDEQCINSEDELLNLLQLQKNTEGEEPIDTQLPIEELLVAFSDLRLKIAEHMKLDDILFLFGNGASMYAGSQDTREFKLDNYKTKYHKLSSVIVEVGKLRGIEEQLNALITVSSYYNLVMDEKKNLVDQLIDEIKEVLIKNFVNSVDYKKLSLHEIFLLKLRTFGCLKRTDIFTSNYDLAFEYSLDKLAIEYKDGFSGFVNRIFDSRTLQGRDKTGLVKIHGSVNWVTGEDGKVKEFQPKFADGKVVINDTAPVLIYPTSHKLYQTYSTPYSELMRHMLDKMETGKNVVIVLGYKYGDVHINEILYKALENPNNVFYFFIYDSDGQDEFIGQLRLLADSMPNINILTGKVLADFRTFVKYILPATPEKTDKEKAIELLRKVLVGRADN